MPAAVIGGSIVYPNLQSIARLFRSEINDTFVNEDGTDGLIMPNTNPDLLTFMDAAIRDLYTDLRNVGDPALILDNYILSNIPPLAAPNPAVQVSLSYAGYFNGFTWSDQWTLPVSAVRIERLWERWSQGSTNSLPFVPMEPAPFGLPGTVQAQRMGQWELRQNAIWMPGCMVAVDLRIRCRITFPDFQEFNPTSIDFNTAYVPILGCTNAIVAKMLVRYAGRFAPERKADAIADDDRFTGKLRLEIVRQMQNTENQRIQYGDAATQGYGRLYQL
jgi:hypothetical protein